MLVAGQDKTRVYYEDHVLDFIKGTAQQAMIDELHQYPQEKILFFPEDRVMTCDPDMVEADRLMGIMGGCATLLTKIESSFDLCDPFIFRGSKVGDPITNGYMQIVNFFYTIRTQPEKEIIAIEYPETNIHMFLRPQLIRSISTINHVKKLFFTTRTEMLYKELKGY